MSSVTQPPNFKELLTLQADNLEAFLAMVSSSNSEYEALETESLMLQCALGLLTVDKVQLHGNCQVGRIVLHLRHYQTGHTITYDVTRSSEEQAEQFLDRFREMLLLSGKTLPQHA